MADREAVKCPVCDGAGKTNRPPWIAGDQRTWLSTTTSPYTCHSCDGRGWILIDALEVER